MRIGKNIHTENRKKVYRKPVMEVVEVDRIVTLAGPSGDFSINTQANPETTNTTYETKEPIFKNNDSPFGGGTPNYDYER